MTDSYKGKLREYSDDIILESKDIQVHKLASILNTIGKQYHPNQEWKVSRGPDSLVEYEIFLQVKWHNEAFPARNVGKLATALNKVGIYNDTEFGEKGELKDNGIVFQLDPNSTFGHVVPVIHISPETSVDTLVETVGMTHKGYAKSLDDAFNNKDWLRETVLAERINTNVR